MKIYTKRYTTDLEPDLHNKFRHKALDYDMPLAEVGRRLIRLWVEGKIDISHEPYIRYPRETAPKK